MLILATKGKINFNYGRRIPSEYHFEMFSVGPVK